MNITYIGTDQIRQNETTIHWFEVSGTSQGFGLELDGTYGWSDCNGEISIVDEDNYPLTDGDGETEAVRQAINAQAWPAS